MKSLFDEGIDRVPKVSDPWCQEPETSRRDEEPGAWLVRLLLKHDKERENTAHSSENAMDMPLPITLKSIMP